ncbi:hypothetical protein Adt_33577 [Abeliophyllum distichum]|uniref:Uncharacterized protein n=1 Tax=Abeliophyllum distichum TaxID=126358 RepID=A0ABD1QZ76_9LAMI
MSLEKAQLELEKIFFPVRLDSLVAKEGDLKAKYEKCAEEAHRLVEERTFAAETAMATANSTFEAIVAEKDKMLAKVKEEIGRVKADCTDTEARMVAAYQDGFEGTSEYNDLAHHFMTIGGGQLV